MVRRSPSLAAPLWSFNANRTKSGEIFFYHIVNDSRIILRFTCYVFKIYTFNILFASGLLYRFLSFSIFQIAFTYVSIARSEEKNAELIAFNSCLRAKNLCLYIPYLLLKALRHNFSDHTEQNNDRVYANLLPQTTPYAIP